MVAPDSGEVLGLELLVEQDCGALLEWLKPYVEEYGVEVIVSDDLVTYKPVVEELGESIKYAWPTSGRT